MIVSGVKKYQEVVGKAKILYYVYGDKPCLLIDSGTHGDEYEVINSVEKAVKKYIAEMPSFIYIPEVSPSAVRLKTRENENGKDLNRDFFEESNEDESKAVMQIIRQYRFNLSVSFHEHDSMDGFYFYDSLKMPKKMLQAIRDGISGLGVGLYSGIDDDNDLALGYRLSEGYVSCSEDQNKEKNGCLWTWLYRNKFVKRLVLSEIPGKVSQEVKDKIVEVIFKRLILELAGK